MFYSQYKGFSDKPFSRKGRNMYFHFRFPICKVVLIAKLFIYTNIFVATNICSRFYWINYFLGYASCIFIIFTSWFVDDARPPVPSAPYIIKPLDTPPTFCKLLAIATPSQGVWVDGVDGWELEGPIVFPVPVLLAGPEDVGPFLFRLFC